MGYELLMKPEADTDFYVLVDRLIDAPAHWGTREHIAEVVPSVGESLFARVDETGTSSESGVLGWNEGIVARGSLPESFTGFGVRVERRRIREFCQTWDGEAEVFRPEAFPADDMCGY